ncbi:MAG: thiamine phosphate synthase, partial [Azoarcus sp.]|nr:thiamine phosphate synthase [Azoarcus sp.]
CDAQLAALNRALDAGLRLIQIREKALPTSARREFVREAVCRIHAAGALAMVNGEPALAHESRADGLHLTAAQLMTCSKRPSFEWVGASCHTCAELEQASALELDYVLIGAVKATPTHPEQAPLGWAGFTALASGLPMPVFALGGLEYADMETARNAGAHGIAAIRGAWDKT